MLLAGPSAPAYDTACAIAALPAKVRGYGHVRQASADAVATERSRLLDLFKHPVTDLRRAG
jgi:indolepyruvate ferredoxin oxidoreductase